jgi:hypothetical protein
MDPGLRRDDVGRIQVEMQQRSNGLASMVKRILADAERCLLLHLITVMPAQAGIRPGTKFMTVLWPGQILALAGMTI